jgi:integrase
LPQPEGAGRIVPYHSRGIFATRAVEGGADSAIVAQCLGHKDAASVKMLISHYLRPDDATLRSAAEKAQRSNNGNGPSD